MLKIWILLNLVLGIIIAEPVAKLLPADDTVHFVENYVDQDSSKTVITPHRDEEVALTKKSFIGDAAKSLFGYRNSALNLAVDAIEWMVSQSPAVIFGTIATIAVCRLTGNCDVNYNEYIPAEVGDYMTPDRLARAEEFAMSAVEKYLNVPEEKM